MRVGNLTTGLLRNVEVAVVLAGTSSHPVLRDAWDFAESLWVHPTTTDWRGGPQPVARDTFIDELWRLMRAHVPVGVVVPTLRHGKPNRIIDVAADGVWIETERSRARTGAAEHVPAWMFNIAWDWLRAHGSLTNRYLLSSDGLNVKRSSAVCAMLAQLPGVSVRTDDGILLQLTPRSRSPMRERTSRPRSPRRRGEPADHPLRAANRPHLEATPPADVFPIGSGICM